MGCGISKQSKSNDRTHPGSKAASAQRARPLVRPVHPATPAGASSSAATTQSVIQADHLMSDFDPPKDMFTKEISDTQIIDEENPEHVDNAPDTPGRSTNKSTPIDNTDTSVGLETPEKSTPSSSTAQSLRLLSLPFLTPKNRASYSDPPFMGPLEQLSESMFDAEVLHALAALDNEHEIRKNAEFRAIIRGIMN